MSIKFSTTKVKEGKLTTTTHTTAYYATVTDEYHNDIATIITAPIRTKISSVTKQLDGCKYYLYMSTETGKPVAMEHDNYGEVGGLWFDGRKLVDYDGCGVLPKEIIKTIRATGYTVPRFFED